MTKFIDKIPFVREYKAADLSVKAFLTFSVGLMLAPVSYSFFWFALFLIGFEIIIAKLQGFDFMTRIVMIAASLIGWVLGRLLVKMDPLGEIKSTIGF